MKAINFWPLCPLILFGILAEWSVRNGWVPAYIFPAPTQVIAALWDGRSEFQEALLSTAFCATLGLFYSFILGVLVAFFLTVSRTLRQAIYPYAIFFQTVPIIAVAPLLVIWFGFGNAPVVVSAFIVSVFPIIASTLLGLESTDRHLEELFELYGARPVHYWWKLKIPAALPEIFNGLRIGIGLAIIGTIVGEFVAGGGLGAIIDTARTQQRVDKVFAAIILSSLMGIVAVFILESFRRKFLAHWHASLLKGNPND